MFCGLYVCVSLEPGSPRGRSNLGEHLPVHCKVSFWGNIKGEYPACARYSQSYSVGGSSDAAFRCRYCSNLLSLLLCPVRVRNIANTMPVCLSCVCLSVCPRALLGCYFAAVSWPDLFRQTADDWWSCPASLSSAGRVIPTAHKNSKTFRRTLLAVDDRRTRNCWLAGRRLVLPVQHLSSATVQVVYSTPHIA